MSKLGLTSYSQSEDQFIASKPYSQHTEAVSYLIYNI
jgi:hypothetical protein